MKIKQPISLLFLKPQLLYSTNETTNLSNKNVLKQFIGANNLKQNKVSSSPNKLVKFYKNQIKTHNKDFQKNPRIKLIKNSKKFVKEQQFTLDNNRYSNSIKKLKIISDKPNRELNNLTEFHNQNKQIVNAHRIYERRRKSQQSNRIFKGITSRKDHQINGRFSVDLSKSQVENEQNQQNFIQHQKINIYHSLIYQGNPIKPITNAPILQSLRATYSKIDRTDQSHLKKTLKPFSAQENQQNDYACPQVLTILNKKHETKFRGNFHFQKDDKQYYHPRLAHTQHLRARRPNTTLANPRRNSQIEPW